MLNGKRRLACLVTRFRSTLRILWASLPKSHLDSLSTRFPAEGGQPLGGERCGGTRRARGCDLQRDGLRPPQRVPGRRTRAGCAPERAPPRRRPVPQLPACISGVKPLRGTVNLVVSVSLPRLGSSSLLLPVLSKEQSCTCRCVTGKWL